MRGGQIGFVFQDPISTLNPILTIGEQISETLTRHLDMSKNEAQGRTLRLLASVGIPDPELRYKAYPFQFSGGMRQRVVIAIAIACSPKIIIADEPTTALDVTVQAQIADLFKRLREELGVAIIWITHDLGVVAGVAERVLVMYGGRPAEVAIGGRPLRESPASLHHWIARGLAPAGYKGIQAPGEHQGQPSGPADPIGPLPLCLALRICL